jgi:signal transduction histidine kinase/ActR/RegA family two-component response regulator
MILRVWRGRCIKVKKINIGNKMILNGLIVLAVLVICVLAAYRIVADNNKKTNKLEAEIKAKEISQLIDSCVDDLNIWGTLLDEFGEDVVIENFESLAKGIYNESIENIRSVQLAPNGVVTYMYPYEGNEEAMGHDLFADPERVVEATLARETGDIILSGPLTLKQGGNAVISRKPIYSTVSDEDDNFWGFVIIVMDLDKLGTQFGLETYEYEGYDYYLYRESDSGDLVATSSVEDKLTDAVEVDVIVPTDIIWKLQIQPKKGWVSGTESVIIVITTILVYLLAMCFMYFYYRKMLDAYKEQERQVELKEALNSAEVASRAKSEFLRRMSHDIRTPINGIMGMTNIALRNINDPARTEDCLHKIEDSSQHLYLLINDVLDMSRIESGKIDVSQQPFDMVEISEKCSSIIRGQLIGKNVEFFTDFSGVKHAKLVGTAVNLERVIINILGNSVKFTNEGGSISFTVAELDNSESEKATFRFTFADTGIGMSEEFLPTIFEEFSQDIDQSRTNYKGTGLGMAITKKYVDIMGGTIKVESKLNVGTIFEVEIPFIKDNATEKGSAEQPAEFTLSGRKLLLVEDNELNAEIAAEILRAEGAEVTIAENGKIGAEVYEKSENSYFDLILMDIMMPEMDGLTATKVIRDMDRADAKTIPIVAMTANAFEEDKKEALSAGMNGYVTKPIDISELRRVLKSALSVKKQG